MKNSVLKVFLLLVCFATSRAPGLSPKVLVFDVIGSCFEERDSLLAQGRDWSQRHKVPVDWPKLVADWMQAHDAAMSEIRGGKSPWMSYNLIYRRDLDRLLPLHSTSPHVFTEQEKDEIYGFWDRLRPRPDLTPGLDLLRRHFKLATLSNGDLSNLHSLSDLAGIKWDYYFSAEQVRHFKPAKEYYQFASDKLGVPPRELMMVASHLYDLEAAHSYGWQTALVNRPGETPKGPHDHFDYVVPDLVTLAKKLDASRAASPN